MPINYANLELATLGQLDPRIAKLFSQHVERITNDVHDRPTDKTPRKIIVEFAFEPIFDPNTMTCEEVKVTIECRSKTPVYRTPEYRCLAGRKGLRFNTDTPAEPDQQPLFPEQE